jgi:Zn-dependent protease with chaperone function
MQYSEETAVDRIKLPYFLMAKSAVALVLSIFLLILLFYASYAISYLLFYLLFALFLIGYSYQFFAKELGIVLDRDSDPKIFNLVDNVADNIGVRRLGKIVMTTDSNIGVTGISDRRLLLGVATLDSMSSGELYAILFHEMAHIKGLDNIIGLSLMRTHIALRNIITTVSRFTVYGLLLGLILAAFDFIFSLTILLYSRQREFLADHLASMYVGGKKFASALENYSRLAEEFGMKVNPTVMGPLSRGNTFKNLYDATRKSNVNFDVEARNQIDEAIRRNRESTSIFSTHPAMNIRLENVEKIKGMITDIPKGKCAELFSGFEGKEEELTKMVYQRMPK